MNKVLSELTCLSSIIVAFNSINPVGQPAGMNGCAMVALSSSSSGRVGPAVVLVVGRVVV